MSINRWIDNNENTISIDKKWTTDVYDCSWGSQGKNIEVACHSLLQWTTELDICLSSIYEDIISSVRFSRSVVSNSLRPHESPHARSPCPSPAPGVHSHPRPSSRWFHPDISSSLIPVSSHPQSLPASESFPMSQLFACGGQSTGASALASVLPKNTQGWSPLE